MNITLSRSSDGADIFVICDARGMSSWLDVAGDPS